MSTKIKNFSLTIGTTAASNRMKRGGVVLVALLGIFLILFYFNDMGFFSSSKSELKYLLGDASSLLVDDAEIAAWQPDPNYKPSEYYVQRTMDRAGFLHLAEQLKLPVTPTTALKEATWTLPPEMDLPAWNAQAATPGAGLETQSSLGSAIIWLRWYEGTMYLVVVRAM